VGVSDDPSLAKAVDAEEIEGRRLVHEVAESQSLLTGGASLLSDRRRGELEDRMGRIEAIVKSSATAEPTRVASGADKQAHGP
jgi:hypothetical protein